MSQVEQKRYVIVRGPMPKVLPGMWSTPGKDVYRADDWHRDVDGTLVVTLGELEVAVYAPGSWSGAFKAKASTLEEAAGHLG